MSKNVTRRLLEHGRRPAWLLSSQLIGRALSFPMTLVIARLGGPALLGETSLALSFYATGIVITTSGLAVMAMLEGGKAVAVSVQSIRRAAQTLLICSAPLLFAFGVMLRVRILLVVLMLVAVGLDLDSRCILSFARGHFRPRYELVAAILNGGIPLVVLLLLFLKGDLSVIGVASCFVIGSFAMRIYIALDVPIDWPDMTQHKKPLLAVLRIAVAFSVLSIIVAVQYRLDQFVLGAQWDPALFGVYSAGARLLDVAYVLPGSLVTFWVIRLQRRTSLPRFRLAAFAMLCALGGAALLLLLTALLPFLGQEFIALGSYRPWLAAYAALMGLTAAVMSTVVAIGRIGAPMVGFLISACIRFVLLRQVAVEARFLPVFMVLCVTEGITIGVIARDLHISGRADRKASKELEGTGTGGR